MIKALQLAFVVFCMLTSTALAAAEPGATPADRNSRPNIIFIVADDLGYGDIAVNGGKTINTPNIDRLAANGVNFTNGHVTAAVCAPSRAALLTAMHQQRLGYEFNPRGRDRQGLGIPLNIRLMPDYLRQSGYRTALIGKWHLGRTRETHPMSRGFDEFFGFTGGGTGYLVKPADGDEWMENPVEGSKSGFQEMQLERGFEEINVDRGYMTDILTDEAVAFIERNRGAPFFLTLTYHAPHTPLQATAQYLKRYAAIEDKATRIYAAMVSAMDDGVGRVMETLEKNGLTRNTLVLFMSDNGCAAYIGPGRCSNRPFQGFKGTYFEGGVRIPMIASWPGQLPKGVRYDRPVMSYDWSVTGMVLGGVANRGFDGVDLMPYLVGEQRNRAPHDRLYWRTWPNFAILDGEWKMWVVQRHDGSGELPLLFNLARDPGETINIADQNPEVVKRLRDAFDAWNKSMPAPGFESQRKGSFKLPDGVEVSIFN